MTTRLNELVTIGGEMKCYKSDDGRYGYVEALGIRFASHEEPDLQGDFFNTETYFGKRNGSGVDATLNHTMPIVTNDEESNGVLEKMSDMTFSEPVTAEKTDLGIVAKHVLDLADEFEAFVYELAEQGAFRWSSGATAHTARAVPVGKAQLIKRWDVGEWAYTPTPAEPRLPAIVPLKSIQYTLNVKGAKEKLDSEAVKNQSSNGDGKTMNEKEIQTLIDTAIKNAGNNQPDVEKIVNDTVKTVLAQQKNVDVEATVKTAVDEAVKAWEAKQPATNEPGINAPAVVTMKNLWKYDHMEPADHALAISILNAAAGEKNIGGGVVQSASLDMVKSLAIKLANDTRTGADGGVIQARAKAAMAKSFQVGMTDKEIHAAKANELNYTTQSGFGDEWIGVAYSNELWSRIVQDTPVLNKIPTMEIPQGAESVVVPLDGAPPTFYLVAQATSTDSNPGAITRTVTTSKQATGSKTMTTKKIGAGVDWTGELTEDAVVNFAAELRRNLQQEHAEVMEHIVIDGDTATGGTTNINDIGGTPGGSEVFLSADGFRKLALVTNTANSRDGGTLAITDFLETIKLMGLAGRNALMKDKIGFILDLWTHWKALELAQVATRDVFSNPTIENGVLANIYGYDVFASANMHRANQDATYGLKANSAGKVDLDTASNNTTGAMLAVRWDQWRMGFARRPTFEIERVPRADAYEITMLTRFGMMHRDNEASAISYNLTV